MHEKAKQLAIQMTLQGFKPTDITNSIRAVGLPVPTRLQLYNFLSYWKRSQAQEQPWIPKTVLAELDVSSSPSNVI